MNLRIGYGIDVHRLPLMQSTIAKILKVDVDAVSLKATTHEKVDSFGRSEAIKAYAACLLNK